MFRKFLLVLVSAVLLLAAVGCQCNGTTNQASPSPEVTIMPTTMPSPSASADLDTSPDLSSSPGIGGEDAMSIPDFAEGTEVKETDVPEIVKAVQDEHKDAKIVSIKQAMQENKQVYAVEIELDGSKQTVYVQPDGTLLEGGDAGSGTGTGGQSGS